MANHAALIHRLNHEEYRVPSQTEEGHEYRVKLPKKGKRDRYLCTCPDFQFRGLPCKHVWAVQFVQAVQTPLLTPEEPAPRPTPTPQREPEGVTCKHCGSQDVTKYGKSGRKPAFWCKPCGRKFVVDDGFKRLKGDAKVVTLALDLYFKGVSLRQITDTLEQFFSVKVGHVTVYNWLNRYITLLNEYASTLQPQVGTEMWHADEMKVKYGQDWKWLWHVMDRETRYLLVSKVTTGRDLKDARGVFRAAKATASGGTPQVIVTDGLPSYVDAARKVYGANARGKTRHLRDIHLTNHSRNNNAVERLNGTVRAREKPARGLKSPRGPLTRGQAAYYNLVRPHQALKGRTPAEAAGVPVPVEGNRWEGLIRAANQKRTQEERKDEPTTD